MSKKTNKPARRKNNNLARELSALTPELARVLHRAAGAAAAQEKSGILLRQAEALLALARQKEMTVSGLAKELGIAANTASELADRLVRRGYVRRREPETDRRRKMLALTPKGKAEAHRFRKAAETKLCSRLKLMPEKQQKQLLVSFRTIITLLGPGENNPDQESPQTGKKAHREKRKSSQASSPCRSRSRGNRTGKRSKRRAE